MDTSGMYVGLDIGTTSIKVIVAEYLKGQLNVIGVGNERSAGVSGALSLILTKQVKPLVRRLKRLRKKPVCRFTTW